MRVLVVEDNIELATLLGEGLGRAGYEVDLLDTVREAELALKTIHYAALILDLGLPDGDGTTLLRMLRHSNNSLPVLVLTARSGVEDRVAGLRSGADDYLTKPFSLEELVARIAALLRRPGNLLGRSLQVGNVVLNTETREVSIGDRKQHLSNREAIVLELLMRRAGNVVAKKLVEDQIFGIAGTVGSNAVEVYVHRLRKELADAGADVAISTVRGLGYLIAPKAAEKARK